MRFWVGLRILFQQVGSVSGLIDHMYGFAGQAQVAHCRVGAGVGLKNWTHAGLWHKVVATKCCFILYIFRGKETAGWLVNGAVVRKNTEELLEVGTPLLVKGR